MVALRIALLGTFEARPDSGPAVVFPRRKAEAVLAYLALRPGQAHARDKLAALLWGDASDERARHSLRQALVTLRQALPRETAASLVEEGDTVRVDPETVEVDVALLERLTAEGTPEALERAAALYRGDLLEGISLQEPPFEDWLRAERERLRELALEALAKLLAHQTRTSATERAVQTAVRLLGLDPTQEAVHRTLMRLYDRLGRRGAALRQYEVCVRVLEQELGAEPEVETRQLYRELLQSRAQPSRLPASPRATAPPVAPDTTLVGRTAELSRLRQQLEVARQGEAALAIVEGEAGIGKTRLAEALAAEATEAGCHVLLGRAHESEQVLPLGPWVDAFRLGQVVPGLVEDLGAAWRSELARLFPELGPPLREPAAGEDYVRLFEAMARTLHHLASARPLLVILEDLHWADEMSLRLLVFVARRIHDAPIAIVGTVRLEEMVDTPALRRTIAALGRQPRFLTVVLPPLSEAETLALVRTLIRAKTEEARVRQLGRQLWHASEGNPFMALEMMRALPADAELAGEVLTPPRVRELIHGRLERLTDRGRRLAAVASVIGREFDFTLLKRAAELAATETAEGVEELVARRILHVVGERLDFTHDRIREVAYDGLLPPYRQRLHEATARALEALHASDLAPHALALGRHYYASEAWDRAADYLTRAGHGAVARSAHRQAVLCFEQAIDALQRLPDARAALERRIDLRFSVRQSCVPLHDHRRVLEHCGAAEGEAEALGDRGRLGWAHVYRAHGLFLSGDSAGAIAAGRRGLHIARELADPHLEESANFYLGQVFHWIGDYRQAAALLRRNVVAVEAELRNRGLDSFQYVNSRTFLAWCLAELGEFSGALAGAREAIAAAETAGSAYWLVHACCGAGLTYLRRGDTEAAVAAAERAVEACRGRDFTALWAISAAVLGPAYTVSGRVGDAIALLEPAAEIAGALGAPPLGFLAEAYLAAGRVGEARNAANRALGLAVERDERGWHAWTLRVLGTIAASADPVDVEAAADAYRGAMALAAGLGMRPLVAHCHLGLGRVSRRTGKPHQAREHLAAATTMYREIGMTSWLARAEGELRDLE
jgi:DNA-binding SARP family transcriptional activator